MRRLEKYKPKVTDGIDVRKVAAVEDFYDIIKTIHVDKCGDHAGQKRTYRIVSYCPSLSLSPSANASALAPWCASTVPLGGGRSEKMPIYFWPTLAYRTQGNNDDSV